MSEKKKSFLLRVDKGVLDAYQKWANDELRSLNGQLDFILRKTLREAGRPIEAPTPAPPLTTQKTLGHSRNEDGDSE
jgi:hypothetical protein